jgi:VWFA-related protein
MTSIEEPGGLLVPAVWTGAFQQNRLAFLRCSFPLLALPQARHHSRYLSGRFIGWFRGPTTHILNRSTSKAYRSALTPVLFRFSFLLVALFSAFLAAQSPPADSAEPQASTNQTPADNNSAEIVSHEEAATFKVNVNLVLVRVVVRDSKGNPIGNLHKEDFELLDNRKHQVITQFSAEQPGAEVAAMLELHPENPAEKRSVPTPPPSIPERYVAYVFDDIHIEFGDLAQVRKAAERHIATLRPTDRAAIFSTSGQSVLDFTDDRAQLHKALLSLAPRPISSGHTSPNGCPGVSYYMADLIENQHDPQALQVATLDILQCQFAGDQRLLTAAAQLADVTATQTLNGGTHESHVTLTVLSDIVRRMSTLPGQRSVVLVSPGFLTPQLEFEYEQTIDRAVRAQVTIGTLDARGLYVPGFDVSQPAAPSQATQVLRQRYDIQEAAANSNILAVLADGTGGAFFQNSNDYDEGFRRTASTPEYSYVLGFSPQNLKLDGSFHSLKVTLKSPEKFEIQARRGYFAPKHAADPAQQGKQEIEDAIFSQEEVHGLPVKLGTQFFKSSALEAKLTVLARIDVRRLHLRKADGRNYDELTVVSALFNGNGNLVQGIEKTVTMHLKDETLEKKMNSGITLKTSFDVKPGSYFVRLVVRDSEAQLLSAENDAVRIP